MKQSLFYYLPLMLVLICCESCKKTNGTIPFVNNDSVQFFYPPKSVYNGPGPIFFNSIVIDNKNNKWVSNSAGIFRFDGANWTLYDSSNMPVNPANHGNLRLVGDSKGTIYSYLDELTDPVLIVYKNDSWTSYSLPFPTSGIALDKATDKLYFLTGEDSIEKYNGTGSFSDVNSYSGFYLGGDYKIFGINVSHDSVLAFFNQNFQGATADSGHCGYLVRNGDGNTTVYNYPDDSKQIILNGIFSIDGKSIYMIGSPDYLSDKYDSFYVHNGSGWNSTFLQLPGGFLSPNFLKYSNDGVLWMSYGWSGMAKYENGQFSFYDLGNSKPYSHIADFAFDSDNVKWLACWEGLIRFKIP